MSTTSTVSTTSTTPQDVKKDDDVDEFTLMFIKPAVVEKKELSREDMVKFCENNITHLTLDDRIGILQWISFKISGDDIHEGTDGCRIHANTFTDDQIKDLYILVKNKLG